ncbi:ATP-dependent DNA helicase RecG [Gaopeijia maritima]|uniref:ATP-dependent DNA helicase RecG n=1 Tax=Gaopeijia maritima TaxID=3119007 RepID=UPI0032536D99
MDFSLLDKPVQFLKGVGPRRSESLHRMGLVTARDVLFHLPRRYDDASTVQSIADVQVGQDATVRGRVRTKGVIPTRAGLRIFQAVLEDDSGRITVAWPGQPWLDRKLREGDVLLVAGPVRFFHGRQIQPREFTLMGRGADGDSGADAPEGTIFVAYPASDEVPQWVLRGVFEKNLDELLELVGGEEYLPDEERERLGLPDLPTAFRSLHRPASLADAESGRRRLAFDELFFLQLVQAQLRHRQTRERPGITFERTNALIRPLHESLPFELTHAQAAVLREISGDMTSDRRMNRMLQGDVGAGKTLVALFAMLLAAEGGWQAVLLAPTELLAEQHARKLTALTAELPIEVGLLTGGLATAERRDALARIADGSAHLVVGTHALLQESVDFARLGLVVVDEQHRFGVRQRMALADRDPPPDVLVMSATPIPRSLALTLYGDLDLSVLDELPPGRQPIQTFLRFPRSRDEVYRFVDDQIAKGRQAYVVYPLVEESEKLDLRAATQEFERLSSEVLPHRRLGLLHGRLSSDEKDATMRAFLEGDLDLLVATSVIEVGIDVANATVMVIEHAERFGLSQLHQLRGRVGRGAEESFCLLVAEVGGDAAERLKVFRDTLDGFEIARADLRIRGQGDLFGAQQHGKDPVLRFADLTRDEGILLEAQRLARRLIDVDPDLVSPSHMRVRAVLEARFAERLKMFGVG